MIHEPKLLLDEMRPQAEEVLSVHGNPWCNDLATDSNQTQAKEIRIAMIDTLASMLGFISLHFPEALNRVIGRLKNANEFLSTLSELFLLFALHPDNSSPKICYVGYSLEYNPGTGSPDITLKLDDCKTIGVEVTRPAWGESPPDDDVQPVSKRIKEATKKITAALYEKVGKFGSCDVRVIALDISDFERNVFLDRGDFHLETVLYGQAKFALSENPVTGAAENVQAIRDAGELPNVEKGPDVGSFFAKHPEIGGVIFFSHTFRKVNVGRPHYECVVASRLYLNNSPSTPTERRFPWDLAFMLANVMNGNNPFTAANLRRWGSRVSQRR